VDLQQRQTQHGHRRHHTRHETKPVPNGRVVLVPNASTNGGITLSLELLLKSHPEVSRAMVYIATFKAGDIRKTPHQHLFIPPISASDQGMVLWKRQTDLKIKKKLEEGWGAVFDLAVESLYKHADGEP
jgi:hypothetical protein